MKLREHVLRLLARREHSQFELKRKLIAKTYDPNEVDSVLHTLAEEGLQSDARYTACYVRTRIEAGFGPRRIMMELRQRGISDSLIYKHLPQDSEFWWQALLSVWQKKYARGRTINLTTHIKAARFLIQRGFEPELVYQLLRDKSLSPNSPDEAERC